MAEPPARRLGRDVAGRHLPGQRPRSVLRCGNVWEWTADFAPGHGPAESRPCCGPGANADETDERIPRRVIKGGSHLCAPNYCLRFRPAARQFEAVDTLTSHIGFRCIARTEPQAPPA